MAHLAWTGAVLRILSLWLACAILIRVPTTLQPSALQQAVLIGFGVSLLVDGLPNLMELAAGYYTLPTEFGLQHNFVGTFGARTIGVGLQMVAGAALIVQSGALAHWLARPPADSEEDEVDE